MSIHEIAYGIGDMFTGFFALGVKFLKWQGSLHTVQCYLRHNLTDEQIAQYLISKQDYDITAKALKLPA